VSASGRLAMKPEAAERNEIGPGSRKTIPSNSDEVIFWRLPEVKTVTGLSKSSLYALIRANSFPAPVQLGPRTVAWVRAEIKQWAAERSLDQGRPLYIQAANRCRNAL
jgi:prophage regulatory protein